MEDFLCHEHALSPRNGDEASIRLGGDTASTACMLDRVIRNSVFPQRDIQSAACHDLIHSTRVYGPYDLLADEVQEF